MRKTIKVTFNFTVEKSSHHFDNTFLEQVCFASLNDAEDSLQARGLTFVPCSVKCVMQPELELMQPELPKCASCKYYDTSVRTFGSGIATIGHLPGYGTCLKLPEIYEEKQEVSESFGCIYHSDYNGKYHEL